MQKCYRNSSTGSTFAIFSWFLYWKMCDRLATIRIWCYTCSCSGNSIDSFVGLYLHMEWYWRIIQKIDALAGVGLLFLFPTISYERLFDSSTSNMFFLFYFCSPLFLCDTYLTHVCVSLYLSMKQSYHRFIVVSTIFIHFYFIFLYLFIIIVLYKLYLRLEYAFLLLSI